MVEVTLWQAPNSQWQKRSSVVELQDVQSSTLRKNRDLIKKCLEIIAKEWNAELVLNPRGICSFQCGGFVVVIDVPWDSKAFFLYTSIMKCLKSSTRVMQKALELNYLTQATSGCTLSLDPNKSQEMEIVLCRSQRVDGTNHHHLISLFKNLLRTAVTVQKQLEKADEEHDKFNLPDHLADAGGPANLVTDDEWEDAAEDPAANMIVGRQEGVDVIKELKLICLEFETGTSPIENLAIELNSFKFSQNATYADCTTAATLAMLEKMQVRPDTSDAKLVFEFKSMLDLWGPLLQRMSIGLDEEKAIVLALERCAVGDVEDENGGECEPDDSSNNTGNNSTAILSQVLSTGMSFRLLLQLLHDEEIVSEEAVLAWAADRKEEDGDKDTPRGRLFRLAPLQEYLDWLDAESDDDDDDDSDDENESGTSD